GDAADRHGRPSRLHPRPPRCCLSAANRSSIDQAPGRAPDRDRAAADRDGPQPGPPEQVARRRAPGHLPPSPVPPDQGTEPPGQYRARKRSAPRLLLAGHLVTGPGSLIGLAHLPVRSPPRPRRRPLRPRLPPRRSMTAGIRFGSGALVGTRRTGYTRHLTPWWSANRKRIIRGRCPFRAGRLIRGWRRRAATFRRDGQASSKTPSTGSLIMFARIFGRPTAFHTSRRIKRKPAIETLEGRQLMSLGAEFLVSTPTPAAQFQPVNASSSNGSS